MIIYLPVEPPVVVVVVVEADLAGAAAAFVGPLTTVAESLHPTGTSLTLSPPHQFPLHPALSTTGASQTGPEVHAGPEVQAGPALTTGPALTIGAAVTTGAAFQVESQPPHLPFHAGSQFQESAPHLPSHPFQSPHLPSHPFQSFHLPSHLPSHPFQSFHPFTPHPDAGTSLTTAPFPLHAGSQDDETYSAPSLLHPSLASMTPSPFQSPLYQPPFLTPFQSQSPATAPPHPG